MAQCKKLPRKLLVEIKLRQLRKNLEIIKDRMQNSEFHLAKLEGYFKVGRPTNRPTQGGTRE